MKIFFIGLAILAFAALLARYQGLSKFLTNIQNLQVRMFNFFSTRRFGYVFLYFISILGCNGLLEAKEHKPFEFNIDLEAFEKMNITQKIDCFIDLGLEHQNKTGEKFKYKKFLKKTYKFLKEKDLKLPKAVKKDVKKLIKERIKERFGQRKSFQPSSSPAFSLDRSCNASFENVTLDRYKNEAADINDRFRGAVLGTAIGVGLVATGTPVGIAAGGFLIAHEAGTLIEETKSYAYKYYYESREPNRNENRDLNNGRHNERKKR